MQEKAIQKYIEILSASFLFRGMRPEDLKEVLVHLDEPQTFSKGMAVYRPQLFHRVLTVVLNGELQVTCSAGEQKRAILNTLHAGDVCGVTALYSDEEDFVTDVTALKNVTLLFVRQSQLSMLFAAYPQLAENYIRFLTNRIRFLNQKITTYTGGQADDRLLRYLQDHSDQNGVVKLEGNLSELARTLDVGRSSLYRSLDTLEKNGQLSRQGKELRLLQI